MSVELEKQINKLGLIKMDKDFKTSLKTELMERTAVNKPVKTGSFLEFNIFFSRLFCLIGRQVGGQLKLLKHAYAPIALVIFMFLGSGVLAMKAAGDSLPGELLYGVKRIGEKAEIAFTLRQVDKVDKEMSFAGNRVMELSRLTDGVVSNEKQPFGTAQGLRETRGDDGGVIVVDNVNNDELIKVNNGLISDDPHSPSLTLPTGRQVTNDSQVIAKAVDDFHNELAKVNIRLDSLSEKPNSDDIDVARAIEKKTGEFAETLNQVTLQEKLSPAVREKIARAFNMLDDVNTRALGVAIKDPVDVDGDEMESLMGRLDDKILATEAQVASVGEIMKGDGVVGDSQGVLLSLEKKIELAKIILIEARESLVARNLEMTLQKVEESKELANEVNEKLEIKKPPLERGRQETRDDSDDDEVNNDDESSSDSGEGEAEVDVEIDDSDINVEVDSGEEESE